MLLQQSMYGDSSPEAPIAQAGTHSLTRSFLLLEEVCMSNKSLISTGAFKPLAKNLLERRDDFHLRVVTSYCLVRVIKIAEILDKIAAPWPCDCFIQKQSNSKASRVRF
jgi:hypothetical protein